MSGRYVTKFVPREQYETVRDALVVAARAMAPSPDLQAQHAQLLAALRKSEQMELWETPNTADTVAALTESQRVIYRTQRAAGLGVLDALAYAERYPYVAVRVGQ